MRLYMGLYMRFCLYEPQNGALYEALYEALYGGSI